MRRALLSAVLILAACSSATSDPRPDIVGDDNPLELDDDAHTETFEVNTIDPVDVLIVVDSSATMAEELVALEESGPVWLDTLLASDLDFHLGVISADMSDQSESGRLHQADGARWVDRDTPNAGDVFDQMLIPGDVGDTAERGRDAVYAALELKRDDYNAGFLRDDAVTHIILISDANEDSTDLSLGEFVSWLQQLHWSEHRTTFSSIVSPDPVCPYAAETGSDHHQVTNAVGGVLWSICSEDWAPVLSYALESGPEITDGVFALGSTADPGSVSVQLDRFGAISSFEDWGFNVVQNAVVANQDALEDGDRLDVTYRSRSAGYR